MRGRRSQTRRDRKLQNKKGMKVVVLVLSVLTVALTVNGYRMGLKQQEYDEKIDSLNQQIQDETDRKSEIDAFKEYTLTREFIEQTAKSKLGLIYKNEILFKNQD